MTFGITELKARFPEKFPNNFARNSRRTISSRDHKKEIILVMVHSNMVQVQPCLVQYYLPKQKIYKTQWLVQNLNFG